MTFETQAFGNGIAAGTTVGGIASNVTSNVSAQYNRRVTGAEEGVFKTEGNENQSVIDFSTTDRLLHLDPVIPNGAIVTDVRGYGLTGSVSTATVSDGTTSQDVSAARDDDDSTWVTVTQDSELSVTGPTAGTVIVKWRVRPA